MTKTTSTTDNADGARHFARRLAVLADVAVRERLTQGRRGIEKESLRVNADATLALTPHPAKLGAALTHAEITTDYSESLLEFITPPVADPQLALHALHDLHAWTHRQMGTELLWDTSMPGPLPADAKIPIARYGHSNIGRFKEVYRRGLALRYGRTMQCIAGIHYNYSLHESIWPLLNDAMAGTEAGAAKAALPPEDVQSAAYMALMRNYRRYSWLLLYLFGASPCIDASFFDNSRHAGGDPDAGAALDTLDAQTRFLPFATSLRMSDVGYQNRSNNGARRPDLNSLSAYLNDVSAAIRAPYAPYEAIGTHIDGEWAQLNTHLLQIENELYATIRPKRIGAPGERVVAALHNKGIQYVEVRCLDIDPFEHVGISEATVRFLDAFLLMCTLEDSPTDTALQSEADTNFFDVARDGRRPGKTLRDGGESIALSTWAGQLFDRIAEAADLLDQAYGMQGHARALAAQRHKLANPMTLPSFRVLEGVRAAGSFAAFGLQQSRAHAAWFLSVPLSAETAAHFEALRLQSLTRQQEIEAEDTISFDDFVASYGQPPQAGAAAGTASLTPRAPDLAGA